MGASLTVIPKGKGNLDNQLEVEHGQGCVGEDGDKADGLLRECLTLFHKIK